ncbi:hypothetical protein [Acinetobacter sp. Ac_5812]|uniref:hypothetical protein n=1 Tax=Acinetobacter sp. Ac_5812 TaxID=1848937 RepID=UPI0020907B2C|nr:hypothetical protein [Acinetobacter sp. Ac_5812]
MSAPTASGAGIAASTLSPAASYEIGQYFKGKDAEGSAAGGAEAAAPLLAEYLYGKKAKDLTTNQKNYSSSS